MKATAVIVNTARAGLVDVDALIEVFRPARLAGADLGVFDDVPSPRDHPLLSIESLVSTPRGAVFTEESLAEVRKRPLEDALRVLRGETPWNPVL